LTGLVSAGGINNEGLIAGVNQNNLLALWSDGSVMQIDLPPDLQPAVGGPGVPFGSVVWTISDLSDAGQIVATRTEPTGDGVVSRPLLYLPGVGLVDPMSVAFGPGQP